MTTKELALKTEKELHTMASELRDDLRKYRFDTASGQMKTTHKFTDAKRTLARILTMQANKKVKTEKGK